jgi:hypothetical protein
MTTITVTRVDGCGAPKANAAVGDMVYVLTEGTWKRGRVLAIRGSWATVRLIGERDVHDWPLSSLLAA